MNHASSKHPWTCFMCRCVFAFFLGIYLGVELLVRKVMLHFIFWGTAKFFPKERNHFTFPSAVYEDSNFITSICWKDHPTPIEFSWHLHQKSIDHKGKGLFLDSQFRSVDVYIYPYSITRYLDLGTFVVSFCSTNLSPSTWLFFFKMIWLFWATCICTWILGSVCQFLSHLGFW